MNTRRAALDGLARIVEATALEELFTGSDDDARFMLDLLTEAARGRQASCYWEVCRTARRRGVAPEFVSDRASVLLGSIDERRRSDVYRVLGVAPLADAESIRHRWLEVAKREHPDVGGDPERFRRAKEAYELLKDAGRRAEYEKYWLRALGPFERVVGDDDGAAVDDVTPSRRVVMIGRRGGDGGGPDAAGAEPVRPAPAPVSQSAAPVSQPAASVSQPASVPPPFTDRVAAVRDAMRQLDLAEIEKARALVAGRIDALEGLKADLRALARLRRALLDR